VVRREDYREEREEGERWEGKELDLSPLSLSSNSPEGTLSRALPLPASPTLDQNHLLPLPSQITTGRARSHRRVCGTESNWEMLEGDGGSLQRDARQ